MPDLSGPNFGYWMTRGTVALVLAALFLTACYYADHWLLTHRGDAAMRADEAKLEKARRERAIVESLKPLSSSAVRRLSMHQERHPK